MILYLLSSLSQTNKDMFKTRREGQQKTQTSPEWSDEAGGELGLVTGAHLGGRHRQLSAHVLEGLWLSAALWEDLPPAHVNRNTP